MAGEAAVAVRIADIVGRSAEQNAALADIDRKLSQIDGAINKALEKGRTNAAIALANDQRHNRSELEVNRQAAGKVLVDLKVEKARIEGDRKTVEADLGPVKYLATLLGTDSESALRVFILVVAMLLIRSQCCYCWRQHTTERPGGPAMDEGRRSSPPRLCYERRRRLQQPPPVRFSQQAVRLPREFASQRSIRVRLTQNAFADLRSRVESNGRSYHPYDRETALRSCQEAKVLRCIYGRSALRHWLLASDTRLRGNHLREHKPQFVSGDR